MIVSMGTNIRDHHAVAPAVDTSSAPPLLAIQLEAREVLGKLSKSLADLLAHIPGDVQRPAHLQHTLGTDYKVSWQIFQIARAEDPLAVSHHVPSKVLMRKLTTSAVERGVPARVAGRVDKAVDAFNAVVEAYADDRSAFDAMLASLAGGEAGEAVSIQHRRNAYRSDCPLWGVQTGVTLAQIYTRISPHGNGIDEYGIHFKHELRRLRHNVMPVLHGSRAHTVDGPLPQSATVALEPEAMQKYGAPLLPQFCSQPLPQLLSVPVEGGWIYSVLDSGELGRKGSADVAFGIMHETPFVRDENDRPLAHVGVGLNHTMPTELVVLELFLHKPSFGSNAPEFEAIAAGPGGDKLPGILRRARTFQMHERVELLGPVPQMEPLAKVPRYNEMVDYIFQKAQWNPAEFHAFRVQIPYPILHTELHLLALIDVSKISK
jgi:hypothetical protein